MMNKKLFPIITAILFALWVQAPVSLTQEYDWAALDEEAFESFQPTDSIMDVIGVREGMQVGEVGAGGGRVIVRIAKRVGPEGHVYANDITASALEYMRDRVQREQIKNMTVVEGTLTDPRFPSGMLDVVYLTNTYRHLERPGEVLKNIVLSLKPDGKLGIVESKSFARSEDFNEIVKNAEAAGFELLALNRSLPRDDIYVFRLKPGFRRRA